MANDLTKEAPRSRERDVPRPARPRQNNPTNVQRQQPQQHRPNGRGAQQNAPAANANASGQNPARGGRAAVVSARAVRAERADRPERAERNERPVRNERNGERFERGERPERRGGNSLGGNTNGKLFVIPLGGIGEIGKNMTVFQYEDDMIIVDVGLSFPEEDMLGVDIVIPDMTYVFENRDKIRAIILTHGHEDHIGALPFLLRQVSNVPVYGTRLAMGLVQGKLNEHGLKLPEGSRPVHTGDKIRAGCFTVEWFRVNHSIADSCGLAIQTPIGMVVHTGDFKFDHTPVDGEVADFHRLAELGKSGVLLLLSDSTNAEKPGITPSERNVGQMLFDIFGKVKGRVLLATFASNVHRIQEVVDAAAYHGKKVTVVGRSMENTVEVARELGYLNVPEGILVTVEEIEKLPANQVVILTTGSQGEPMSALTRMSVSDHKKIEIIPGDTVIIAATPIPGNEKLVSRTISNLFRRGAHVISGSSAGVHVSGHASQEELKLMINLVRPKFFVPIHGEYRHLVHHSWLAQALGIPSENILISENGAVLEFTREKAAITGKVTAGMVLVDGLGVGDVGNIVLRDRKQLSQDGILIVVLAMDKENGLLVSGPDIVSRGFVYVREAESLMDEARERVKRALDDFEDRKVTEWATIKSAVRDVLGKMLFDKTRRRPMILPIIVEV